MAVYVCVSACTHTYHAYLNRRYWCEQTVNILLLFLHCQMTCTVRTLCMLMLCTIITLWTGVYRYHLLSCMHPSLTTNEGLLSQNILV